MKELWKVLDSTLSRRFDIRIVLWYRDDPRVVNSFVCVTLEVSSKSHLCLLINVSFMCISCFDRYQGQICSTYSVLFRSLNSIHSVFLASCAQSSHSSIAQVLTNCRRCERCVSETETHHKMTDSVVSFIRRCVPRGPNMINYLFSTHLQLCNGNGKGLSL